jgi:hypothetical protein
VLQIPSREVVFYVSKFSVAAIFVAGAPSGMPVQVNSATDIGRSLAMICGRWPQIFSDDLTLLSA